MGGGGGVISLPKGEGMSTSTMLSLPEGELEEMGASTMSPVSEERREWEQVQCQYLLGRVSHFLRGVARGDAQCSQTLRRRRHKNKCTNNYMLTLARGHSYFVQGKGWGQV